jgi:hypothetical protein
MMKTKKEIQHHLNNFAYNKIGAHKIVAFLLGKDIIKKGEKLNFKNAEVGEKQFGFDFFYQWFTTVNSKDVLDSLFEDLNDKRAWAIENEKWEVACRTSLQIMLLVDSMFDEEEKKKKKGE